MKKFLYFSAAALTTLFAASCSSEEPNAPVPAGEGATFTINLPADLQTRANDFGNGKAAPNLHYAVYAVEGEKAGQPLPVFEGGATENATTFDEGKLQTKVTLDLPHGVKYNIVFFACNDASKAYTFNAGAGTFTVNYENMNAYSEDNDCFIYTVKDFSIQGPTSSTVTLYRPVAQLNIGTSDYAQAVNGALDPSKTQVTVNNVYKTFNFLAGGEMTDKTGVKGIKGQAEGNAVKATFGPNALAIPSDETFPYEPDTYKYMSMNYVLVGNEKDVVDVNFKLGDKRYNEVAFNNVPMQRNYRTNIFGSLLTSPADFDVIIEPDFNTPDYNYTQEVAAAEDLANALAEGKTAKLTKDITLENMPSEMLNNTGVINLNNHTLTVNNYVRVSGNLTIENGTFATGKDVAFDMLEGGNLSLANVKGYAESSFVLVNPKSNTMTGSVKITDCELTGRDYCISTNATILSSANIINFSKYSLVVNNTKMSGCETPMLINIPIQVQVNDSQLTGSWQAMVLRGCNATLNNNVFTTTCEKQANTESQASGNNVPRAALTVLNGAPYSSNAIVYAYDNTFNAENVPTIYALKQVANKFVTVSGARNILNGVSPVAMGDASISLN